MSHIQHLHSYRATIVPKGTPVDQIVPRAEAGTLPTIRLKATNAHRAELAAHHVTGLPVVKAERIEPVGVVA